VFDQFRIEQRINNMTTIVCKFTNIITPIVNSKDSLLMDSQEDLNWNEADPLLDAVHSMSA